MSATQTPPPAGDPSMEDILASIRRILSEEDAPDTPRPPAAAPDGHGQDVLVLNETMLVAEASPPPGPLAAAAPEPGHEQPAAASPLPMEPPIPMPAAAPPAAASPVLFPVPRAEPAVHPEPPKPEPEPTPMSAIVPPPPPAAPLAVPAAAGPVPPSGSPAESGLTSPETDAAAAGSVGSLIRALAADRTAHVYNGGPTIADLVREEMRPLLKSWLDANLPPLVERMVRVEIERVIARAAN